MAFTKIKIEGIIEVLTGLHIGGDGSFSAIGAIDLPVVRDPLTRGPIIPGSTLKGKMRSLLARDKGTVPLSGPQGFNEDCYEIKRLFGSSSDTSKSESAHIQMSRLQFYDCFVINKDELEAKRIPIFETKFENTIDRLTAKANPRQIERVVRGTRFGFELIYNMEELQELEEDFANIRLGLNLIENDYLGGGGTRGNGRVRFTNLTARVVTGDTSVTIPRLR